MKQGCRELEECEGFSFSSWRIDGPHILRGGGRHPLCCEMLPNKGKEAFFCFVYLYFLNLCYVLAEQKPLWSHLSLSPLWMEQYWKRNEYKSCVVVCCFYKLLQRHEGFFKAPAVYALVCLQHRDCVISTVQELSSLHPLEGRNEDWHSMATDVVYVISTCSHPNLNHKPNINQHVM